MAGDDTEALQSVLECDEEREGLLRRERELLGRSSVDGGWGRVCGTGEVCVGLEREVCLRD